MKEKNSENKKRKIITIDLEALKDLKDSEIVETLSKTKSQLINNAKKIKENKENVEKIEKLSNLLNDTFDSVCNTCSEKYKEIKNKKDIKENIDENKKTFEHKEKNDIPLDDLINHLHFKKSEHIDENIFDDIQNDCIKDCSICFDGDNEDDEYDNMLDIMNSVYFIKNSPIFVILEDNITKGKVKEIDFDNQKLIVSLPVDNDEFELVKKVPFEMLGISATQNEDKVDDLVEYYHLKEAINQKLWIDKEGNAFPIQELTITELKNIKNTIEDIFDDPIEESKPKLWYYDKFLDIIEEATFDL